MKTKKPKIDKLILHLSEIKLETMHYLPKRVATLHAIDTALKIAGWELAAELQGDAIDAKKVRDIYLEMAK